MVLYRPTKRYLIQVLEHAEEEYGGPFGTVLTSQLTQTGQAQQVQQPANMPATVTIDPTEIEKQLTSHLSQKLVSNPTWRDPVKLDKDTIEEMEERYRFSEFLDWNDIECAYAYEGIIIPGGKIMMGRWWRCGMFGTGEGLELSADGQALGNDAEGDEDAMDLDVAMSANEEGKGDGDRNGGQNHDPAANAAPTAETPSSTSRSTRLERGPFVFWC